MLRRLVIVLVLVCPWAMAAPKSYIIDTDNTDIRLSWRAFGGILSWATFSGVTGAVTLNPENDVDDHIHVTIPVATLVASNKLLTWQLKSDMFLNPSATRLSSSSALAWSPRATGGSGCSAR